MIELQYNAHNFYKITLIQYTHKTHSGLDFDLYLYFYLCLRL